MLKHALHEKLTIFPKKQERKSPTVTNQILFENSKMLNSFQSNKTDLETILVTTRNKYSTIIILGAFLLKNLTVLVDNSFFIPFNNIFFIY